MYFTGFYQNPALYVIRKQHLRYHFANHYNIDTLLYRRDCLAI